MQIKDILSPEAQKTLNNAIYASEQISHLLNQIAQPLLHNLSTFLEKPEVQRYMSIVSLELPMHPIYPEIFEGSFGSDDIEQKWPVIKEKLKDRFPEELNKEHRKDRYLEALECQSLSFHMAVCRMVYPEIEALFRDEFLLSDPEWIEKRDQHQKPSSFQQSQARVLVKNEHPDKPLLDKQLTLRDIDVFTAEFVFRLDEIFGSFEPKNYDHPETKSYRHIHAHGWKKTATFMDGFHALLLYDLALQFVIYKKGQL